MSEIESTTGLPPEVIIIGAGRSGTNMLRDILVQVPGFATWPCDEINYIWRHGNRDWPTDEFTPEHARPEVAAFIRGAFAKIRRRTQAQVVVEKTCASSLRPAFIDTIFPDSKFVFIARDGRDVAASAARRWTASLDIPYLAAKARYVPVSDLPYYASRYFFNHLNRRLNREKRLSVWGPRIENMQALASEHSTEALCALQWQRCVQTSLAQLGKLPASRVYRTTYETFTAAPAAEIQQLANFLGIEVTDTEAERLAGMVRRSSVGKWKTDLADPAGVEALIGETLADLGYRK